MCLLNLYFQENNPLFTYSNTETSLDNLEHHPTPLLIWFFLHWTFWGSLGAVGTYMYLDSVTGSSECLAKITILFNSWYQQYQVFSNHHHYRRHMFIHIMWIILRLSYGSHYSNLITTHCCKFNKSYYVHF